MKQSSGQEFSFSKKDFERVRQVLYAKAGIKLADSKDSLVYSRLARRLRVLNIQSFQAYLDYLEKTPQEQQPFINALTTNLTAFFREPHHFDALAEYLKKNKRKLTIWCAASSTGEEPYSIAMIVAECFGSFDTPVSIVASDIDSNVLEKARNGIYSVDAVKKLSAQRCRQFFHRGTGRNQGKVRIVPELRKMVLYKQINLMHSNWALSYPIDIIFCRNVMIYFDKPTQVSILKRMIALMPANGMYVAGHSENFNHQRELVTPMGQTIYAPVKSAPE